MRLTSSLTGSTIKILPVSAVRCNSRNVSGTAKIRCSQPPSGEHRGRTVPAESRGAGSNAPKEPSLTPSQTSTETWFSWTKASNGSTTQCHGKRKAALYNSQHSRHRHYHHRHDHHRHDHHRHYHHYHYHGHDRSLATIKTPLPLASYNYNLTSSKPLSTISSNLVEWPKDLMGTRVGNG